VSYLLKERVLYREMGLILCRCQLDMGEEVRTVFDYLNLALPFITGDMAAKNSMPVVYAANFVEGQHWPTMSQQWRDNIHRMLNRPIFRNPASCNDQIWSIIAIRH